VDHYRQHAADKIALAGGDTGLKAAILNVRDAPSVALKQAAAAAYLATVSGAKAVLARELLSGPLLQGRVA
jgi:hypothetical protein